jgi:hypothetical protein
MNLSDYQHQSRATALYPDRDRNLWYPTLGLMGEVAEYLGADESQKLKEAGDVAWYCAQLCSEAGLQLETILASQSVSGSSDAVMPVLGRLAECVKKLYRDRQGEVSALDQAIVAETVKLIWSHCIDSHDQALILSTNIAKLQSRQKRGVIGGSGDDR